MGPTHDTEIVSISVSEPFGPSLARECAPAPAALEAVAYVTNGPAVARFKRELLLDFAGMLAAHQTVDFCRDRFTDYAPAARMQLLLVTCRLGKQLLSAGRNAPHCRKLGCRAWRL